MPSLAASAAITSAAAGSACHQPSQVFRPTPSRGGTRGERAEGALGSVGDQCAVAQGPAGAVLRDRQRRHDHKGGGSDGQPGDRLPGRCVTRSRMLGTARSAARAKRVTPMSRTALLSRSSASPRNCQTTTAAAANSITESRPKPTGGDGGGDDTRGDGDGSLGCHPGHAGVFQPESPAAGLAQMLARSAGTPLDGVCRVPPAGQARCSPSSRKARSCAGQDQCQGRGERVRVSFDAVRVNSLARSLTWLPFPGRRRVD
jgi:hypothetical protein